VKVFRSIDSNSVEGFPEDPNNATKMVRKIFGFFSLLIKIVLLILFRMKVDGLMF
jgi:hypothetical protein